MDIEIPEIPADLSELSIEELEALHEALRDAGQQLREAELTDEVMAAVETVAEGFATVRAALEEARTAHAERTAARDAALSVFNEPAEPPAAEEGEPPVEAAGETEPPAAPAGGEPVTGELVELEAHPLMDPAQFAQIFAAGLREGLKDLVPAAASQPANPVPPPQGYSTDVNLSALAGRRPVIAMPQPTGQATGSIRATKMAGGFPEGTVFETPQQLGQAIIRTWTSFGQQRGGIPAGVEDLVSVAQIATQREGALALTGDQAADWDALLAARQNHLEALVASTCAPFPVLYDFFRLAQPNNPVERALTWLNAPRGGLRFIAPPDWSTAAGAIGTRTCAEDADPEHPDKPVLTITCPDLDEICVDQVSQRVRFKNLNFRTFPEQVAAVMADVNVAFVARKEQLYIDAIDGGSTAVNGQAVYGAARSLVFNHSLAAVKYRARHHMADDAVLEAFIPYWALYAAAIDVMLSRRDYQFGTAVAEISRAFADARIAVTGYYEPPTAHGDQLMDDPWAADLGDWPTEVVSFLFAPGTFVGLETGMLEVGPVRDSVLNGRNELELFMEEWRAVAMVGLDSIKLVTPVCVNGSVPDGDTLRVCAGS